MVICAFGWVSEEIHSLLLYHSKNRCWDSSIIIHCLLVDSSMTLIRLKISENILVSLLKTHSTVIADDSLLLYFRLNWPEKSASENEKLWLTFRAKWGDCVNRIFSFSCDILMIIQFQINKSIRYQSTWSLGNGYHCFERFLMAGKRRYQ